MDKRELGLWSPLIGFDVTQKDKGVAEYLHRVGMKPDYMCLLLFNADVINYHVKGMPEKVDFPPDFCNYYGSPQNDMRKRQSWSNYDLKDLCKNLKENGVESYMSVMGVHLSPESEDDDTPLVGQFGYVCKQDFVMEHRELACESTRELGYINLLKRFKGGSSFGDYFIQKAIDCVTDYGMDGLHFGDCIFPPNMQIQHGDFSDDFFGRFVEKMQVSVPEELLIPLKDKNSPGIEARADYVWNRYRGEWIRFNSDCWEEFFTKLCAVFHENGKKVMVNNAWTLGPFESYYRYGIDYKALERAGVDIICVEDQGMVLRMTERESKDWINDLYVLPLLIKAYAPKIKLLGFNYAKDSTEEGSMVNHNPMGDEHEIYKVTSQLYVGERAQRAVDGLFVCLADSVKEDEWRWLKKRYDIAYRHTAQTTLSPTLVWSDNMVKKFLPEYEKTRRYSVDKIVAELSRLGSEMGASVRVGDLDSVSGLIFVPNIDVLDEEELEKIRNYTHAVVYTSMADKKPVFADEEIYFEDPLECRKEYRMCAGGFNLGLINYREITEPLGLKDAPEKLIGESRYIEDSWVWLLELVHRIPGEGFMKALARLLCSASQKIFKVEHGTKLTVYKMENGYYRLFSENESMMYYKTIAVQVKNKKIKDIVNASDFPVQPLKLMMEGGAIRPNLEGEKQLAEAKGFIIKLPPSGSSFVDVLLEG